MDFRIIQATGRPIRQVLVRKEIDGNGAFSVVAEMWVEGSYHFSQRATFDTHEAAEFYVDTFSTEAAKRVWQMAFDAWRRDNKPPND